jgi:N-acylneuraminate cytidylyltransferase
MNAPQNILCLIPARGGSKGLPGKNIRPLAGMPLIAHSVRCASMCPSVSAIVCSSDDEAIRSAARAAGARTPFDRPAELAADTTPMWDVVQHALQAASAADGVDYDAVLLLDPTSPGRLPEDVESAIAKLRADSSADGVVGVSEPEFNPIWHCVVEANGYMQDLVAEGKTYTRRQDLPRVFRINASLYLWRAEFIRSATNWREGTMLLQEIPESRAIHIDTIDEFEAASEGIASGKIHLPWMENEVLP